jgi:LPS-assembly protein
MHALSPRAFCGHTTVRALLGLLCAAGLGVAHAQSPLPPDPKALKFTSVLNDKLSPQQQDSAPTFLRAGTLSAQSNLEFVLLGQAELRRADRVVFADRLEYILPTDTLRASGHVMLNQSGNLFQGDSLALKVDAFEGVFEAANYQFLQNEGHGEADRINFLDEKRAVAENASYTTCKRTPGPSWMPDWIMRAATMSLDSEDEVGHAQDAALIFKGTPLVSLSSVSFPLSGKRKSGILPPTFGVDSISGTTVTTPYYWDIAPNRDATVYPTLMSKRGLNMGGEFRYLESAYSGQLRAEYMPEDKLSGTDRWGYALMHQGLINTDLASVGDVRMNLNLNRVSDDAYWRDFPRAGTALTQRLLPNDVSFNWAHGDYAATFRTLSWQTLQDPASPIIPPYDRMPQLAMRYVRLEAEGVDLTVDGDFTQFQANRMLTGQPNAQRNFVVTQISRPWLNASGFIVPKLQLHAANYQFDTAMANGDNAASRVVPTFSLNTGLVFERDAQYFGSNVRQTLEPRLYYVNTPYVPQNYLPNYDTGLADFNFASIYTENTFIGNDRIADNKMLTAGLSTRLFNPDSGAELARFGVAQRYRFADQYVTLPGGTQATSGLNDILLGAGVTLDTKWMLDSTIQYNPSTQQSVRSTVAARYNPGSYRVLNMAYRFQRDASELLDLGWQWPINDLWGDKGQKLGPGRGEGEGRWYSVGRLNYSLQDAKLVDSLVGFEYDAGCWLGRVVVESLSTGLATRTDRLMFQLEFVGFSRLGIDPLSTLKSNIPRYQYLREPTGSTSRFSNYD